MTEGSDMASFPMVAVAVDKDKSSQSTFKWALDNVVSKGQTLILIHVNVKSSAGHQEDGESASNKDVFLPFRLFCKRKYINSKTITLEDTDVAKAIMDFVSHAAIEKLVLGTSRSGFVRAFKGADMSSNISKGVPDFCTVYIICKGKVSSVRNASRPAPAVSPLRAQIQSEAATPREPGPVEHRGKRGGAAFEARNLHTETESVRSPHNRGTHLQPARPNEMMSGSDASFRSSGGPSMDRFLPPRLSYMSDGLDRSFESIQSSENSLGSYSATTGFSSLSRESFSSHMSEEMEAEINRLKLELKQTMDRYSAACREAHSANQKTMELQRWKMEERRMFERARVAEEAALALAEKEQAKSNTAIEAAQAAKRVADLEAQKRMKAEMKARQESEETTELILDSLSLGDMRCRKYRIEEIEAATEFFAESRKIGEGGYGPVFKCYLDHTPVAVKVLRPDAPQGKSQFQHEVDILSCIRHPHMVLLLGACQEYGCLVYEYMANGSLEDRLFRRGNTPPLSWQQRFRIAAEIGTGLLFLHQSKPEPLVHRDLKPANILLDQNYVSKISDVGLARLLPSSMVDNVTQCRMTAAAGTLCYIDPEYQVTGMVSVKSDIYSLGVILLQLITGKHPMGLTHHVERCIEKGTFAEVLDPSVPDWPIEETLSLAMLALKCAELKRKDRPDLGTVVLPELFRLRVTGEESMQQFVFQNSFHSSTTNSQVSIQDMKSGPLNLHSGYESSASQYIGSTNIVGR